MKSIFLTLCFLVLGSAIVSAGGQADNVGRAIAKKLSKGALEIAAKNADDAVRIASRRSDNFARAVTYRLDNTARVTTTMTDNIARLGLKQGDDIIYDFSRVHRNAARTLRTTTDNIADVAFTGLPKDVFINTYGKTLYNDIISYSLSQNRNIIAAVQGRQLLTKSGNVLKSGQINGIQYRGDDLRDALIGRYNRIDEFVGSHKLGRNHTLLNGWQGNVAEVNSKYNISLTGRETAEEIANIIAKNGKTNNQIMTSTILEGTENAVVRAQNYALFTNNIPVSDNNIKILRRIEGTAETRGFNISNQTLSHAREPGYFLTASGLKTEVISATSRGNIIEVVEKVIP